MIKSVATALPTYVMSCFRLPTSVVRKITFAIAQFWWSPDGLRKGIHWVAWQKLCRPKGKGGLGFQDIQGFNTALLAKQLWRLIDYPNSLFARVLRGRYCPSSHPLEDRRVSSPSYGWRSIISARSLVRKGTIRRVGNGMSIHIWNDPWIPALQPRPAMGVGAYLQPIKWVSQLIDPLTKTWRLYVLSQYVEKHDVDIIKGIPISMSGTPDQLGWHYTITGKYSVKSGYHVEQDQREEEMGFPVFGPQITDLQARVWQIQCPRKLQHFMWQVITGCLPVMRNLAKRGTQCDSLCERCNLDEESINHALFECPPSLQVWALSLIPSAIGILPTGSIWGCMHYLFSGNLEDPDWRFFPWILWYIWKSRNQRTFVGTDRLPHEVLEQSRSEAKSWLEAQTPISSDKYGTHTLAEEDFNSLFSHCFTEGR